MGRTAVIPPDDDVCCSADTGNEGTSIGDVVFWMDELIHCNSSDDATDVFGTTFGNSFLFSESKYKINFTQI